MLRRPAGDDRPEEAALAHYLELDLGIDDATQPEGASGQAAWPTLGESAQATGVERSTLTDRCGQVLVGLCLGQQHACRRGQSAYYQRVPRLSEELRIRHANGTFTRWLETLKNTDVLLLDDWGMTAMDAQTRADLLEIVDDRANVRATIITSQLPIEHWHEWIGDATIADAMLDRLMQNHHRFKLTGESMRKNTAAKPKANAAATNPEGA